MTKEEIEIKKSGYLYRIAKLEAYGFSVFLLVRSTILASDRTDEEIKERLALFDKEIEKFGIKVEAVRKAAIRAIDAMKRGMEKEDKAKSRPCNFPGCKARPLAFSLYCQIHQSNKACQ